MFIKNYFVFIINYIKKYIVCLIRYCYFATDNQVFQQITDIAMGSDPVPFLANLFLFFKEWQHINNFGKKVLYQPKSYKIQSDNPIYRWSSYHQ